MLKTMRKSAAKKPHRRPNKTIKSPSLFCGNAAVRRERGWEKKEKKDQIGGGV